jgi:hypothetical protein
MLQTKIKRPFIWSNQDYSLFSDTKALHSYINGEVKIT